MNKSLFALIRPLLIVFVAVTAVGIAGRTWLIGQGIDPDVLLVGNFIVCAATVVSLFILLRGGSSANPQSFVRSMYASFLIRFFIILIAAFIYIMTAKKAVNKPALMICAGLYILYAGLEISALLRSMKKKKDA